MKLDTQARQAVSQGREDLARAALERKTVAQTELQSLDTQVAELEKQQEQLIENEKKLRTKIETFRTKKEVIKAQYSAAEAQVKISEAANGVGEEMADLGLAIQRAEDKTEQMRARAGAVEELEAAGAFDDITQLGAGQDDIDRELAADRRRRPGGRRAGEDEGRARLRRRRGLPAARAGREGGRMIVRVVGGGAVRAARRGRRAPQRAGQRARSPPSRAATRPSSRSSGLRCSTWWPADGTEVGEDELVESDVILPPRDISFAEAAGEFTGEGLIPD